MLLLLYILGGNSMYLISLTVVHYPITICMFSLVGSETEHYGKRYVLFCSSLGSLFSSKGILKRTDSQHLLQTNLRRALSSKRGIIRSLFTIASGYQLMIYTYIVILSRTGFTTDVHVMATNGEQRNFLSCHL